MLSWLDSELVKDFWAGNLFSWPVSAAEFREHAGGAFPSGAGLECYL